MRRRSVLRSNPLMNLPNQITVARLILTVVLFFLIPFEMYWTALVVFLIAAGTDWLDGWIARKYDLVSKLGRILDPFADKLLICGTFIYLSSIETAIAPWMTVVVVGREFLVTVLRSFLESEGQDFSAKMAGKLKMVFQCAAVVFCLIRLAMPDASLPQFDRIIVATVWLAVISTIYSGVGYIFSASRLLKSTQS